jgi:regulator of ribosome biosynthesis
MSVSVVKSIPLDIDLGHLLVTDIQQPFDGHVDAKKLISEPTINSNSLLAYVRDNVQVFMNSLFQLSIQNTEGIGGGKEELDEDVFMGPYIQLPESRMPLPRARKIPAPKPDTLWQEFAKAKGIRSKPKQSQMEYNEEHEKYMPRFGSKSAKNHPLNDWIRELGPNDNVKDEFSGEPKRKGGSKNGKRGRKSTSGTKRHKR